MHDNEKEKKISSLKGERRRNAWDFVITMSMESFASSVFGPKLVSDVVNSSVTVIDFGIGTAITLLASAAAISVYSARKLSKELKELGRT